MKITDPRWIFVGILIAMIATEGCLLGPDIRVREQPTPVTPEYQQELRAYASEVLRIAADLEDDLDDLFQSAPKALPEEEWYPEVERLMRQGGTRVAEYAAALRALHPPEEAWAVHQHAIAWADDEVELFRRAERAAQDRNSTEIKRILAAFLDMETRTDELNAELRELLEKS